MAYNLGNNIDVKNTITSKRMILNVANNIPNWITATDYIIGDYIEESNKIYKCIVAHTSGTFSTDAANWTEISKGAKLPERINSTSTLVPGIYDIDSSTASFNITLTDEIGEWFFTNTNFSLDTNAVTFLSGGTKTFTNSLGVQTLGDFVANKGGKDFNVLHTELGNDYRINTDTEKQLSPVFRPNGGWNASTNIPDLTVNSNKVNGNDYYVYYVTATGSQNLGSGVTIFEAGGRIEWYSNTVYNYVAPVSSTAYLQQTLTTSGTITDWGYTTIVNSATPVTITLPLVGISSVGETVVIKNIGLGLVTVIGNGTDSLSGSITLNQNDSAIYEATALGVVHAISEKVASATIATTPLTYARVNMATDLASVTFTTANNGVKIPFNNVKYSSGITVVGTDVMTPTVSGRYRISWLMQAGSGEFAGNGYFVVMQNNVFIDRVFYDMMEAAGVNQCAGFIDADLTANLPVELRYQPQTSNDAIAWQVGSYFQLDQLPTAIAPVVNTVAEHGEVILTSTVAPGGTANTLVGTVTLPSAGTWQVNYVANLTHAYENSTTFKQATALLYLRDSSSAIVPNSYAIGGELINSSASNTSGNETKREVAYSSIQITTTEAATYTLRIDTGGGGNNQSVTVNSGSSGSSKITYVKIAGALPSTGTTVDVFRAGFISTGFGSGGQGVVCTVSTNPQTVGTSFVNFTTNFITNQNSGVFTPLSTGIAITKAGIYSIKFKANVNTTTSGSGSQLIINSTVVDFGKYNENASATDTDGQLTLHWTGSINANDVIKIAPIRQTAAGTDTFYDCSIEIIQLGSTATVATTTTRALFRGFSTAVTAVTSGVVSVVTINSETFDTTNSFAANTFTCPRAGFYRVTGRGYANSGAAFATGQDQDLGIYKNGTIYALGLSEGNGVSAELPMNVSALVQCNVGDTLDLRVKITGTSPTFNIPTGYGEFSVEEINTTF